MQIRIADRNDVPALARLAWWNASPGQRARRSVAAFTEDVAGWWEGRSHVAFVATVSSGALVGMAWLALVARPPRPGDLHRHSGDIQSVFVLPEHRGAGVGSALVRAAADYADGQGVSRVTVHSGSRAVPVYERLGFGSSPRLLLRLPS